MLLERYEKLDMVDHWSSIVDVDENEPPDVREGWRLGLTIFIEHGTLRILRKPITLGL